MMDHEDMRPVPDGIKDHLQEAIGQFFANLIGPENRAVVVFPGMSAGENDLPLVVSNYELDDADAIISAMGLIGPLVHEGHPIKCASLASLLGVEQAQQCAKCDMRGKVPLLQEPGACPEKGQCCQ